MKLMSPEQLLEAGCTKKELESFGKALIDFAKESPAESKKPAESKPAKASSEPKEEKPK